jgi:hypothetical protein
METITIVPNNSVLVYVLQNEFGDYAKGLSLADAQKNFKIRIKGKGAKYKAKHLAVYIQKGFKSLEANTLYGEIQCGWMSITFTSENLILLQQTTLI